MAVVIIDKVGRSCANGWSDVVAVQDALNRVPLDQGGTPPHKKIPTTGTCGPQTIEAIQLFQLKQFGWPGADGKIFPGGETHSRLNQILGNGSVVTEPQSQIDLTTNSFIFHFYTGPMKPGRLKPSKFIHALEDVWIEIEGVLIEQSARYVVRQSKTLSPRTDEPFGSSEAVSWPGAPISLDAFDNAGFSFVTRSTAIPWNPDDMALDFNLMSIKLKPDRTDVGQQDYPYLKTTIWEPHHEAMMSEKKGSHHFKYILGKMERLKPQA